MKAIYDLLTIVIFFIIYKLYGFYAATAAINILLLLGVIGTRVFKGYWDKTQLLLLMIVLFLSIPTFVLHDEIFFKWKPTLVSWFFSFVLLYSQYAAGKKSFMQHALESQGLKIEATIINRINLGWAIYFIIVGLVNLYFAYYCSTNAWVNFKLFGTLGSSMTMIAITIAYLYPYLREESSHE